MEKNKISPWILLVTSAVLLTAAFLTRSFPVLIFVAIAPLFALADEGFLKRLGPLPLILFWLAIEYIVNHALLANIFIEKLDWIRWTQYTGMGGVSLWILLANLFLYLGLFRKWPYTLFFVIVIVGPIFYSYTLPPGLPLEPENGEWVARTAAWISVLILLSAVVKELTRKK